MKIVLMICGKNKPVMESNEYIDGVVREYSGFRQIIYMYACYKIEGHI